MELIKAVFFDKDGVLNVDKGIHGTLNKPILFDDVPDIIADLRNEGYLIIVITNQAIVARGIISEAELINKLNEFKDFVRKRNSKAIIDNVYYCPHHPHADVIEYRVDCSCRKPKSGMIKLAQKEYNICLEKSWVIGDRMSDIIAGYNAGCKTILVRSGKHNDSPIVTNLKINNKIKPDYIIDKITEAVNVII